ncbi:MAG TPA: 2-oxo acid dehydrogenase subunit E2, partial [Burkholderiales bacterium]|nr:2-oxo acid dehydrogenase subunit E2 [Burkholderiales bacterium]
MLIEVKVPVLSESVSEATLLSWHKRQGEFVQRDENLIDIETDKVVLELPAPEAGVLASIVKADGAMVTSNEVIATIDTAAKASAAAPAPVKAAAAPAPVSAAAAGAPAMPAAKKLADEKGLKTEDIAGTGRGGRVLKEDVMAAGVGKAPAAAPAPAAKAPSAPVPSPVNIQAILGERPEQRVAMSRLRKRVAERLVQSQSTAAILTTFNEVNMAPVMEMRKKYQDRFEKEHGVKLGFMSFFIKAAIHALKKFPVVNASVDGDDIVYHGYFDIGIAVGSPRGLVVPII